jgi:glycerol-3-phosphate dehydrogenase (NAD(P)+)
MTEPNNTQPKPINIAVVGGGSWATALTKILSEGNVQINWWMRSAEDVKNIAQFGRNPSYLSNVQINLSKVKLFNNLTDALTDVEIIVLAVPAAFISDALKELNTEDFAGKIVVSAIKGMIPKENVLVTQYIERKYNVPKENILVIVGPCHAEEVAMEKQSYLTIGGYSLANAKLFAHLIRTRFVKSSVIKDIDGAEYCAVMKNIISVACGIARGLNYGDNFQAVLVSNAMQEIRRFIDAIDPMQRDLSSSAYLGDLLVTSYSQFSRNRTFGNMVGRGYSVKSAQMEMNMIAEGYYAVKCVHEINQKYNVDMPITEATFNILYENISPMVEFQLLAEGMK